MIYHQVHSRGTAEETFIRILLQRATHQPDELAYNFLLDGEMQETHLTYAGLDHLARSIGAALQTVASRGERVLLLYPPGLEYISAFFGCLYAGMIAVPAYPPDPTRLNRTLPRLQAIVADAQATIALTTSPILSIAEMLFDQAPDLKMLHWMATDCLANRSDEWQDPAANADTLAFLQYTSGSTGTPRGVMLTHGNLLHNSSLIHWGFGHTPESRGMVWLPPYHDMGLIGGILQPLYGGFPVTLMSPIDFLKRPLRWLQAISRYRATISGGPNFAYDLCVRKITSEERATLDLSCWEVAFNGAEPVRYETMERFAQVFAPCGFRPEAFYPCYGLAEATLIVSGGGKSAPPVTLTIDSAALGQNQVKIVATPQADIQTLVGCGSALADQRILIVHPDTLRPCSPDQVGEIWVSGPSVAQGYWNQPEKTTETFRGFLADTGEGPFLRTGDLGFLRGGELFVTGRIKDLIIIRGRNHYPQDIELSVERSHPAFRPGCCAAFSIPVADMDGEQLVVVQEVGPQLTYPDEAIQTIRQAVAEQHDLQVYAVCLLRAGAIPKTSSGKIQRQACRDGFLSDSLESMAKSLLDVEPVRAQSSQSEANFICKALKAVSEPTARHTLLTLYLQEQAARVLQVASPQVNIRQPLSALGLDSLMAVELKHRIETDLGLVMPMLDLLQGPSISQLASHILAELESPFAASPALLVPMEETETEHVLSHGQRAMWFLHQLAPQSTAYNIASAVRIRTEGTLAKLDIPALHRAFQSLVNRHPILRTTFPASSEGPVQHIHSQHEVCFQVEEASMWSELVLNERLSQEAHRPFDLEQGPLLRVRLFNRSAQEHILLLVVHHIIADFWSLAVLAHELGMLYGAERTGSRAFLPPLTLQYADYTRWQTDMLAGPEGPRLWDYWRQQLAGELPALDLPTDHPRPSVQTYRGASQAIKLGADLTQKLKALGQSHQATLYTVLLAAFQVLLHRYTGQSVILVGSPTAGRNRAELKGLIGYFVNPVVLRAEMTGDPPFTHFLDQIRQTVLSALAHQNYAFNLLVEQLQPERDLSRSPIFQAMFILQQSPLTGKEDLASFALGEAGAQVNLGDLSLESVALEQRTAQFDLTLVMADIASGLGASLQYNSDLFEAATMRQMLGHFQMLLEGIVADPTQRLSDLPLLPEAERHQLLCEWNQTNLEYSLASCLHDMVQAQVDRSPDAVAVVWHDEHLTYRQLNRRAGQLASHLQAEGLRPEELVGICLDRTPAMVIGLLGVLKAGGAYVPLDPAYPPERIAWMVADAAASVILTQRHWRSQLPEHGARLLCLDTEWDWIASAGAPPHRASLPANLAYVIYTSGSTGRPKGVAISHHSAVALLAWAAQVYAPQEMQGVLAATSLCFDLSVYELFLPLSRGGTVVLADNALEWMQWPDRARVTLINTVPSAMAELMRRQGLPASVRTANLAGEPLARTLVQQVYAHTSVQQVYNLYGPSEDTTYSTFACLERAEPSEPTIGRPIGNTQAYVLDAQQQLVPQGGIGELYLGGEGLARGYLNRPELTAERFVPHPFASQAGARLYRTGDLVRYRRDGALVFLGRRDNQVKVRGFRIELGEIESALSRHPQVRAGVVVVCDAERTPGDRRLVAYIVAEGGATPSLGEWRSFLRDKLPDYMVPSAFVVLPALPLTPNGKVDRRALPAPDAARPELEAAFVVPRTPIEECLAEIWAEILKIEQVGIHDNFFELGGHSLLATQVISRIREAFQIDLTVQTLFEVPTIAALSAKIEAKGQQQLLPVQPILPVDRAGDLPLSFAQQRLWFLDQLEGPNFTYNMPAALKLTGQLNVPALESALNEIVRRHEVLRTTFTAVNGRPVQVIAPVWTLALPVVDLQFLPEDVQMKQAQRLATHEGRRPFDLTTGPLLRATLLRCTAQCSTFHVLLFTMHHIISDGWSAGILIQELSTLYAALGNGLLSLPSKEHLGLPKLPIQYADFAAWQREWLSGPVLETQLAYWKQQLSSAPARIELPTDRPRPPVQTFRGSVVGFELDAHLTEQLEALSRRCGATLFMTLYAAFATLLSRYSQQDDIVIGSPIADRNRKDIESLIGFFVNTLALRLDLAGNPTFLDLLGRARRVTLEAYAHQDIPFDKLVDELRIARDLRYTPLAQMAFAFGDFQVPTVTLPGLVVTPLELDWGTAKTDLTLFMQKAAKGLSGLIEYSTDLFEPATISGIIQDWRQLLNAIASDPAQRLADLWQTSEIAGMPLTTPHGEGHAPADIYANSNLTRNQLLVWLGQKLQPDIPLYNLSLTFTLPGPVQPEHWAKAFQTLVNSSDALRTVIEEIEGIPQQRVMADCRYHLDYLDFSNLAEPEAERDVWVRQRGQTLFDFEKSLFESALIKLADDKYVWFVVLHHIVSDGFSIIVLMLSWMLELYRRSLQGQLEERIDLPPFQDYVAHEHERRRSIQYRQAEAYWAQKLAQDMEPIRFYGDSLVKRTTRTHRVYCDLGPERKQKLKEIALGRDVFVKTQNVSLFNIMVALFCAWLHRISGAHCISLGTPLHNRHADQSKEPIGLLMEVFPLHITIEKGDTFLDLIKKAAVEGTETRRHSQYTVGNPVQKLFYDVFLNYLGFPLPAFNGAEVKYEWHHIGHQNESLLLQVLDYPDPGSLVLRFDFHCDVFNEERQHQTIQHFLRVVDAFLDDRTQPITRFSLLAEQERQRVLFEFNRTEAAFTEGKTITQLLEAQVIESPDRVAVEFNDQALTYVHLNTRAGRLGRYLQSHGVGPETLVGLCVERSLDMMVGLIGIFKAGGAYVPLDPAYPQERLAFMLQDVARAESEIALVLLTQTKLAASLPKIKNSIVICLDSDWSVIAQDNADALKSFKRPLAGITAQNLAYVMYTSGSTGQPKGVMIPHQALAWYTQTAIAQYGLTSTDRMLQFSTLCFDISVEEIYPCLACGATLVLRTEAMLSSIARFFQTCQAWGITYISLPTAFWHEAARSLAELEQFPTSLRMVCIGGDKVLPERIMAWRQQVDGHVQLINTYGPTETTVIATLHRLSEAPEITSAWQALIGRVISGAQVYVLDAGGQPVPIGIPGELCIGGKGPARGYLHQPALTAEKFVPHPLGNEPGARLYKTGDMARYLPDGNLEFLGRADHQVKVRGFRVELGEIEATLGQHPAVQEAVVVARSAGRAEEILKAEGQHPSDGELCLVAYVVPCQEQFVEPGELRHFLKAKLPEYMVPSAFMTLKALPLMPNGKVDRQALPVPDLTRTELRDNFVAPRTPIEELVAGIWAQALELRQAGEPYLVGSPSNIGVHDNFFELGGHSLLATQVISRIRNAFQVELPLRALFEAPTVAGMAQCIEIARGAEHSQAASPLQPVARGDDLPLSFAQQRLWFLNRLEPGSPSYNIPTAVRLAGPLRMAVLEQSLNEIIRRHEVLRTTVVTVGGRPVQVIAPYLTFSLPVIDLRLLPADAQASEAKRLMAQEAQAPFDLSQGPLVRSTLLVCNDEHSTFHILLFTMHHIVSDGWSLGVLVRELATLYSAFSSGASSTLPELPIQYADFAIWQRQRLQGKFLEAHISYWKQQLAGAQAVLDLPTDRPRPPVQTYHGATQPFELSLPLSQALKALSQREGATLFMTLLAAFKTLLHRYTGQTDILVGTPIANRNRSEIEGLIGLFVNALALRTDLAGNPTFHELLGRVREMALDAYAHQDLPFEMLVEAVQPQRSLSHSPLFQVMFVLQNAPMPPIMLPGLTLSPLEVDSQTAKFDLTLFMVETERGLTGSVEYNTDLFDHSTVIRLLGHFQTLLEGIVADPTQCLSELPILPQAECSQLLWEWNQTCLEYLPAQCLHDLFQVQVERTPEAIAVVWHDEHLTYRQLNRRAEQLASHLQAEGLRPEELVGICLDRTPAMVIGLLGVLKAGGAYVPLDPAYPPERIAWMVADAAASVILMQEHWRSQLPEHGARLLCLDTEWDWIASAGAPLHRASLPANLAYVIYTSGSTGRPKGMAISHHSAVALLAWAAQVYAPQEMQGVLAATSLCFDLSVYELFLPLSRGGTVALADNALEWMQWPDRARVTLINTVPSAMAELVRGQGLPASVRTVNLAGEPLARTLVQQVYAHTSVQQVYNLYGPSEDTTYSTFACLERAEPSEPTIGRPIGNTQAYVLDAQQQLVPQGGIGELYLGGEGLARGYLNRPNLTAERFAPHPFASQAGARLYRTGDLVRCRPDGQLIFLGRRDHQVKLRGFRIELGEIESALSHHPQVRAGVVMVREDAPGDRRLVAYVVVEGEAAPSIGEWRSFLRDKLPDYMMPSAFVVLPALPLTPNGKVDRRALPAPDAARPELEAAFVAPRTPIEECLAEIWAEILKIGRVGIHDNFFELGGHSLLATQVASRVQDAFQIELPLYHFVEKQTITELAVAVEMALIEEIEAITDETAESWVKVSG